MGAGGARSPHLPGVLPPRRQGPDLDDALRAEIRAAMGAVTPNPRYHPGLRETEPVSPGVYDAPEGYLSCAAVLRSIKPK